ncbi:transcription initiation factor TFIID subunit D6 [Cladophialophora carrionii]|uniref:Transcription initiation factor TFIID subunit D6 n=1 Tax=Cladophialophora carrionii TaxID=86049 RepID=A0A1C1CLI9_9EURO|nr:transcription initiation factor TFIID subunit D6 [Cladophialophora carrionii]
MPRSMISLNQVQTLVPGEKWSFTVNRRKYEFCPVPATPCTSFLTLNLRPEGLLRWPATSRATIPYPRASTEDEAESNLAQPDGVEEDASPKRDIAGAAADDAVTADESAPPPDHQAPIAPELQSPEATETLAEKPLQAAAIGSPTPRRLASVVPEAPNDDAPQQTPRNGRKKVAGKPNRRLHTPTHRQQREAKSILKPDRSAGIRKSTPARGRRRSVAVDPEVHVHFINETPPGSHHSNGENESPVASSDNDSAIDSDGDEDMSDPSAPAKEKRPNLKISFSRKPSAQAGGIQPAPVQTPVPQSATARTPSIKLKLPGKSTPLPVADDGAKPKKNKKKNAADTIEVAPGSNKKRKRESVKEADDDEGGRPAPSQPSKPPTIRTLKFKTPSQTAQTPAPKATGPANLLFKVKGKIPKRTPGVGYDSELESEYENDKNQMAVGREKDPVIHEGFILRMQPGQDCDYLRKSIEDGKAGEILSKGGAAINLRMLDTLGRRGILQIKDHKYATSLVDLPCILEGMKSWDKKGWIKSIDICQMLLVLGRCKDEQEARNYPLPEDVDPKSYQYAHGITAPMKWVRKRRFARTKRARVDDIEAVERRVHALLEADKAAVNTKYQLLDHDPRLDEHGYSTDLEEEEGEEDDEDEDAEAEPDNYFGYHPGAYNVSTPMVTETPVQEEIDQDDFAALERMFYDEDKGPAAEPTAQAPNTLHPPEVGGDSSFAVTSTSATPSATAEHTPAGEASSDEDEDDAGDDDEDRDDAEKEGDESKRQALERIDDMTNKIAEQRELLKKTTNAILKKKLARRIQDLEDDVAMMRKNAGLGGTEDDE